MKKCKHKSTKYAFPGLSDLGALVLNISAHRAGEMGEEAGGFGG